MEKCDEQLGDYPYNRNISNLREKLDQLLQYTKGQRHEIASLQRTNFAPMEKRTTMCRTFQEIERRWEALKYPIDQELSGQKW